MRTSIRYTIALVLVILCLGFSTAHAAALDVLLNAFCSSLTGPNNKGCTFYWTERISKGMSRNDTDKQCKADCKKEYGLGSMTAASNDTSCQIQCDSQIGNDR